MVMGVVVVEVDEHFMESLFMEAIRECESVNFALRFTPFGSAASIEIRQQKRSAKWQRNAGYATVALLTITWEVLASGPEDLT